MNAALYVIAILGCGEGEAPCQPVALAETRYESREACLAGTEAVLARHTSLDFPIVVAECRAAGAGVTELRPAEVLLPEPDRRPSAWDAR